MLSNVVISEVKSEEDFNNGINIYEEAFPPSEKRPVEDIKRNIAKDHEKMFIGKYDGNPAIFIMMWPVNDSDFLFLDYIAVKKEYRGKGLGSTFLKKIFDIEEGYNHVIFEVENPNEGDNKSQRMKRIKFYRRAGAKTLTGFKYFLPPRNNNKSQEMKLMIMSRKSIKMVDGEKIQTVLEQIYTHIYNRKSDDKTLNGILDNIPDDIHLE
ncbi:GNAT family N-acetyltransferase [Ferroplasma sp.]|uniref:GNAT family N-acetyltransferase n=1 Tax=Ferroplasma sp. TaxID=2591003 RepID=UPI002631018A|nr:GNAT family N-acetyltransferase [Ferroplasma sp.]MCL4452477.1 GNAT family N-acetyltransferase [Candidatus Thermoplasmatota archaeon]